MNSLYLVKTFIVRAIFCSAVFVVSPGFAQTGPDTHANEEEHGQKEEHEEGHIKLTPEQITFSGIGLAEVSSASIRETLPLYGQIVANTEHIQAVGARFEGVITQVTKQIGDPVLVGDVLAKVESNDSLKVYTIKSSIAGVLTQRNANVGEQTSGRTLFEVADFSTVWGDLSVFPNEIRKLRIGQLARIKCSAADVSAEGKVIYITPFGNSTNQTTKARVMLDNPQHLLVPGHFITAELTLSETQVPVAINSEAIQIVEERNVVFVKGEEGFEPREVTLGRTDGEFIEVLTGLKTGETYVTVNSFILKSELGKEDAEHGH